MMETTHAEGALLIATRSLLGAVVIFATYGHARAQPVPSTPQFEIPSPASVHQQPITGRMFLMISRQNEPEVRLQAGGQNSTPVFRVDVDHLQPGQAAVVDGGVLGYPLHSLKEIPPGDYYVQALLNVYTEFHGADGHVIWAHMDQGEGQQFNLSPGNLYSTVQRIHSQSSRNYKVKLSLMNVIPPVQEPAETEWMKHLRIQSTLLTSFWGHPIDLGAFVLLPRGYSSRPDVQYPVVYAQGHFSQGAFGSTEAATLANSPVETPDDFLQTWKSDHFPRMIAVTFQHPTPYYDESFVVNSANNGPYGDAIMTELIPYIEEHFRIIRQPYARVLTGGSAGGFNSLALQLFHPEFFGGTWSFALAEIDFRAYYSLNIYDDDNAFALQPSGGLAELMRQEWSPPERFIARTADGQPLTTVRRWASLKPSWVAEGDLASGSASRKRPTDQLERDGYPKPFLDRMTGQIDHSVATTGVTTDTTSATTRRHTGRRSALNL